MAVNITRHCLERYVERIKGITDKTEKNAYITNNRERLEEHINTMFSNSEFVFRGRIGGDNTTKNFYISSNNICLVMDDSNTLITLYRIIFDFPSEINEVVIDGLRGKILELSQKIEEVKQKNQLKFENIENKKTNIDLEIAELEAKIKTKKMEKEYLTMERNLLLEESNAIITEQQRYCNQLLGMNEYKADVKAKG